MYACLQYDFDGWNNQSWNKLRAVLSLEFGPFKILLAFISILNTPFQPTFVTPSPL